MSTDPGLALSRLRKPPRWWQARSEGSHLLRLGIGLLAAMLILAPFGDLSITSREPWQELGRMLNGLVMPTPSALESPVHALILTVAFALWGTLLGALLGLPLALLYSRSRALRAVCAGLRAVHELFWALLLLQVFGLSAITALAAITIPYAATFAKVYAEILEQVPQAPRRALPAATSRLMCFVYAELPLAWSRLASYTRYRFECALRASVLLGFVGLPTLGFYLESAFREGRYHEAGALLWIFYLLIATLPWWGHRRLLPLLGVASLWWLGPWPDVNPTLLWRFLSHDIWPAPLVNASVDSLISGQLLADLLDWASYLPHLLSALGNTLLLGLLGTAGSLLIAMLLWPLASRHVGNRVSRQTTQGLMIFLRTTPELMLAFILLLLLGPSLLPAWLALSLHNGAIIAFLCARHANQIQLPPGKPRGRLESWLYEINPRVAPGMFALLFYRAETIIRETAILGMLGVATLGFHIDSSFEYLMFDQAFALLLLTAILNIVVDSVARRLRPTHEIAEDSCIR
ncbi:ABC transporter permease [Cobetia sp. MMG027]|uniref:PhnE/PtxC family ABC transporter permease n=1 Tax=Cobetia sp. MMG027 TaxID=3021980 RepID=UPI0022FF00D3|nr:ABC transporter permease [Cobetia sp. MMG027]MDA5563667.1 ABC transporter permease [Cobetia sp. MMG027]